MRLIGLAERALERICRRTASRAAFGARVSDQTTPDGSRDWLARENFRSEMPLLFAVFGGAQSAALGSAM
jgi:acyl-CoA dehydrogenase